MLGRRRDVFFVNIDERGLAATPKAIGEDEAEHEPWAKTEQEIEENPSRVAHNGSSELNVSLGNNHTELETAIFIGRDEPVADIKTEHNTKQEKGSPEQSMVKQCYHSYSMTQIIGISQPICDDWADFWA